MSEQPLPTKERIRAALDVLENYVGTDGKIDATKMTQEITRLRQRVAELEKELNSPVIESEWQELQRKYKERGERMKVLAKSVDRMAWLMNNFDAWFNPETGEPL